MKSSPDQGGTGVSGVGHKEYKVNYVLLRSIQFILQVWEPLKNSELAELGRNMRGCVFNLLAVIKAVVGKISILPESLTWP